MTKQKIGGAEAPEEAKAEETKQSFFFPSLDRAIQASSIEEATEIAEKELGTFKGPNEEEESEESSN